MHALAPLAYVAAAIYVLAVFLLALYGLHSFWLLSLLLRHRKEAVAIETAEANEALPAELPRVLVQLPVFNERDVVHRLVEAVGRLDWPADKLHIQLLDDSTDDSVEMGRVACARLRERGLDAVSIHRLDRSGFKAGALDHGMQQNDAPFIAIFDADFVPDADFLKKAIKPLLHDEKLCLVQGRWEHLNRHTNLLTSAQALGIDGHFAIEQGARAWSGLAMNFNGTCGLWRRAAIIDAGGWEHDTLTEDMDLSYRAQLKGWTCTYRIGLAVPGEVPATVSAWRTQQFRWAKGSIQTAIKLLPRVWRSSWGFHAKLAATLHMTHYLVHPLILVSLFCAPLALMLVDRLPWWVLMLGFAGFLIGASSPIITYVTAQVVLNGRNGLRNLRNLPALAAIGTGIAVSNSNAVWQALRGKQSEFVRTPKGGNVGKGKVSSSYKSKAASGMAELFCCLWAAVGLALGFTGAHKWVTPLLALYFSGFLWMAIYSIRERLADERAHRDDSVRGRSPLPFLIPAGVLLVVGALTLSFLPRLISGADSWRHAPAWFGGVALGMSTVYLAAVAMVRARQGGTWTIGWVIAVAFALRIACLGLAPSDDVNRYLFEGRQVANGQNPYIYSPAQSMGGPASEQIGWETYFAINHPEWASIYQPVTLAYETLVTAFSVHPLSFKIAGLICDLLAMGLVVALLMRARAAFSMVLLMAWNPVGPLMFAGEGHHDEIMTLLLGCGLYLATGNHLKRALVMTSLAALAKPFAVVALLPQLSGKALKWWLLPPLVAIGCYLPFSGAGMKLFSTLGTFGGQGHFHGVLEPWLRLLGNSLAGDALDQRLITAALIGLWLIGTFVLMARARVRTPHEILDLTGRLLAWMLVCLPTLHLWYFAPLVLLLPFTTSFALVLWTAMAPVYWLHAVVFPTPMGWGEAPLITAVAHLPALALMIYESVLALAKDPVQEFEQTTQTA